MVVMIASIDLSQETFAIDMLGALKSMLKHCRKHVQLPLQLYEDQALTANISCERSMHVIITTIWRPSHSWKA